MKTKMICDENVISPSSILFARRKLSPRTEVHHNFVLLSKRAFTCYSEPAKIDYRRAFNSPKHKKSIHNFIESEPTDQNAYCIDICNT